MVGIVSVVSYMGNPDAPLPMNFWQDVGRKAESVCGGAVWRSREKNEKESRE